MSDEHAHDEAHHVNYTAIFGVLCVCTLLSIAFDVAKDVMSRNVLVTLVLAVAACKAAFVLLYFMHIKFESGWKYVLLAPTMVLACALPFALAPDMAFHYYNVIVPQSYVSAAEHGAGSHGTGEHGEPAHDGAHGEPKHDDHDHAKKTDKHDGKKDKATPKKEAESKPKADKKKHD